MAGIAGRATRIATDPESRGHLAELLGWIALAIVTLWLLTGSDVFEMYLAGLVIIYAISALGLDWIQGRAGQVSIGSAAFMAVGAYVTATAAEAHVPLIVALLLAGLAGGVVGLVFGLPALRLRHLYLALSTLALQFITQTVVLQYETASGNYAGFFVPSPKIGPLTLQGRSLIVALVAMLALVSIVQRNIYRCAPGRAWLAIKESQMAAAVIGINVGRWKLSAFVGSSAVISLSGGLLAYYTLRVFDDTFSLTFALSFVAMVIVGGLGSITGVILGATLITIAPYVLSSLTSGLPADTPFASWLQTNIFYIDNGLYGVILLGFLLYQPRGIIGALDTAGRWIISRLAPRLSPAPEFAAAGIPAPATPLASGRPANAAPGRDKLKDPVLAVRDLHLVYRTGAQALARVDLDVRPGEIVALLGRNGAGKTSTLRVISGFFAADKARTSGSVRFGGSEILGASPVATSRRGIIMVPERDKVFPSLTVAEHFRLIGGPDIAREEAEEIFPALKARAGSPAGLLSGGERQMLALALAWCAQPRLLLVDELSLGLAPGTAKRLASSLRDFRDRTQVPILLVEQNVSAAIDVADRVYIMEAGRIVYASDARDVSRETVLNWSFGPR
jgi:branched-chain amino acid transport system permease protein